MGKYSLTEAMLDDELVFDILEEQTQHATPPPVNPANSQQQQPQGAHQPPVASDVKNITQKMGSTGVSQLLQKINTQQELEQFLSAIFITFTGKLTPQVIRTAIQNAAKRSLRPGK